MPVAATVLLSHCALLWIVMGEHRNSLHPMSPVEPLMLIIPPEKPSRAAKVPLPELHWVAPRVDSTAITAVSFADPDADVVKGVIAPASAPQLDPAVTVDSIPYALRAGLRAGDAVTIVLGIEVLADGSTGQVAVQRDSGSPAVDAAAIEYARALRWIPATVQRRARAMRINFAVTLAPPG
jgi:TonB family protein